MTPRRFELQTLKQLKRVLIAEDRDIQLAVRSPDMARPRILDNGDGRVGRIRYRLRDVEAVGGLVGADGHLHRTARQIEERTVSFDAGLLDMKVLVARVRSVKV